MPVRILALTLWHLRNDIKPILNKQADYYLIREIDIDIIVDVALTHEEAGLKCQVAQTLSKEALKFQYLETSYQTINDILDNTHSIDDNELLKLVENPGSSYAKCITIQNLDLRPVNN